MGAAGHRGDEAHRRGLGRVRGEHRGQRGAGDDDAALAEEAAEFLHAAREALLGGVLGDVQSLGHLPNAHAFKVAQQHRLAPAAAQRFDGFVEHGGDVCPLAAVIG